ncbi:hypothetical protein GCM10008023_19640 [Sphingomonas glacialis]|uniref:DNA-binding protein n=1 Tax=Sphingomonas glacialis TaxID=658225 RepID=A0ABQ3LHA3_9SPHN|nr:helix-turn-helix domain-containing protein [Sphingomonas glacialis]GHH16061.1 hypothetical protein GCM10008023_19640 [Sphingomonas glacialis]
MDEPFLSIPQAQAELGGISRANAYNLINRGDLELVKLGRKSLITGRSINRLKNKLLEQIAA